MARLSNVLRRTSRRRMKVRPENVAEQQGGGDGSYPESATLAPSASDTIPNLTLNATILSVQSGNWSSTSTWDLGRAPQAGDIVGIKTTHTVTYDVDATTAYDGVGVAGTLQFRTNADTQLWTTHLFVYDSGSLIIGTTSVPVESGVTAEIVFRDVAIDTDADPEQYGNGLVVLGTVTMHGQTKTPFRRLAGAAAVSATELTLDQAPTSWADNDEVVISHTRPLYAYPLTANHWNLHRTTISSLSDVTLTIADALTVARTQAKDAAGVERAGLTAHVGNITRNVILRSENPTTVLRRGHVIIAGTAAQADIRYVRFKGTGRTTFDALDNTSFDGQGAVTHVGTNQVGRYAVHFHHLGGTQATRFRLTGCAIDGGQDTMHTVKWPIAVHGSKYGLVEDNVCWNWAGAGIVVEDGTVTNNTFQRNLVIFVRGNGHLRADTAFPGREGDGFWAFQSTDNTYTDNVACNCTLHGFAFFRGNNFRSFTGNETYCNYAGLTMWYINGAGQGPAVPSSPESLIQNFTAWNTFYIGIGLGYPAFHVTFDNCVVLSDPTVSVAASPPAGFTFGDYQVHKVKITNSEFQGFKIGIDIPLVSSIPAFGDSYADGTFIVEDTYLHNLVNVHATTPAKPGQPGYTIPTRKTLLRNCVFNHDVIFNPTYFPNRYDIQMQYLQYSPGANLIVLDEIFVENFNNVEGDDFQVFYYEQRGDFILPQTGSAVALVGSPDAGKTNQQNWDDNGVALAGAVLPEGVTDRSFIYGKILEEA